MFTRHYDLEKELHPGKVLLLTGARQVGKTTLLRNFLKKTELKYKLDSGDNIRLQELLGSQDFARILPYAEGYELIAIDEAQNIPNIGTALKILVDERPDLRIIATGSASFELTRQVGEPLTGRKKTCHLFPVAQMELLHNFNRHELKEKLGTFLIYGAYPEVAAAESFRDKESLLNELVDSYLLKDVLALETVKSPRTLLDLLKLLAFQIGKEVSLNELAGQLHIDVKTAGRYLELLEKSYILLRSVGFSRNLRSEVTSKHRYYFTDNGIRNAVISRFNPLSQRDDIGMLWENFMVIERQKFLTYSGHRIPLYFWRTYSQQEIDWVEERDGRLFGYECKWSSKKRQSAPREWIENYPEAEFTLVTPDSGYDLIL
ncbi:MAG: ATP-binding protein [Kiritimatiellales bacterium]